MNMKLGRVVQTSHKGDVIKGCLKKRRQLGKREKKRD